MHVDSIILHAFYMDARWIPIGCGFDVDSKFDVDSIWIPCGFKMDSIANLYGRLRFYVGSIWFLDRPDVESMQILYRFYTELHRLQNINKFDVDSI